MPVHIYLVDLAQGKWVDDYNTLIVYLQWTLSVIWRWCKTDCGKLFRPMVRMQKQSRPGWKGLSSLATPCQVVLFFAWHLNHSRMCANQANLRRCYDHSNLFTFLKCCPIILPMLQGAFERAWSRAYGHSRNSFSSSNTSYRDQWSLSSPSMSDLKMPITLFWLCRHFWPRSKLCALPYGWVAGIELHCKGCEARSGPMNA